MAGLVCVQPSYTRVVVKSELPVQALKTINTTYQVLFFSSLISLIAYGPHHYHSACGH